LVDFLAAELVVFCGVLQIGNDRRDLLRREVSESPSISVKFGWVAIAPWIDERRPRLVGRFAETNALRICSLIRSRSSSISLPSLPEEPDDASIDDEQLCPDIGVGAVGLRIVCDLVAHSRLECVSPACLNHANADAPEVLSAPVG
jgi:hypothetical protein